MVHLCGGLFLLARAGERGCCGQHQYPLNSAQTTTVNKGKRRDGRRFRSSGRTSPKRPRADR